MLLFFTFILILFNSYLFLLNLAKFLFKFFRCNSKNNVNIIDLPLNNRSSITKENYENDDYSFAKLDLNKSEKVKISNRKGDENFNSCNYILNKTIKEIEEMNFDEEKVKFKSFITNNPLKENFSLKKSFSYISHPKQTNQMIIETPINNYYNKKNQISPILNSNLINKKQLLKKNILITTLYSIIFTITHFCTTSFHVLNSIRGGEPKILLNEYYKRYKAFVDVAQHSNNQLENINILVNYIYDYYHNSSNAFPKFSILRMFLVIWNKEVLMKLVNYKNQNVLIEQLLELYKNEVTYEYFIRLDDLISSLENCTNIFSGKFGDFEEITLKKIKQFIKEYQIEDNNFCFIEGFLALLGDSTINEYSVFELNHSNFKPNSLIEVLLEKIKKINLEFILDNCKLSEKIRHHSKKSLELLLTSTFKDIFTQNIKLFPFMKKSILSSFFLSILDITSNSLGKDLSVKKEEDEEFFPIINTFNSNICYNDNNVDLNNLQIRDFNDCRKDINLYGLTSSLTSQSTTDQTIIDETSNYIKGDRKEEVSTFFNNFINNQSSSVLIKDIKKISPEIIEMLQLIKEWKLDLEDQESYIDDEIEKDLKRRKIPLKFTEEEENLLKMDFL